MLYIVVYRETSLERINVMIVNLSMAIPSSKPKITGDIYGLNQGGPHILIGLGTCSKHNINFINLVFKHYYIYIYTCIPFSTVLLHWLCIWPVSPESIKAPGHPKKNMDEHHRRRCTFHYSMANKGDISCTITRVSQSSGKYIPGSYFSLFKLFNISNFPSFLDPNNDIFVTSPRGFCGGIWRSR